MEKGSNLRWAVNPVSGFQDQTITTLAPIRCWLFNTKGVQIVSQNAPFLASAERFHRPVDVVDVRPDVNPDSSNHLTTFFQQSFQLLNSLLWLKPVSFNIHLDCPGETKTFELLEQVGGVHQLVKLFGTADHVDSHLHLAEVS